jgi:hypothetical protein
MQLSWPAQAEAIIFLSAFTFFYIMVW